MERITKSNVILDVTAATTAWLGAFIFDQLFCSYAGYICEDNYLLPIITQRQFWMAEVSMGGETRTDLSAIE